MRVGFIGTGEIAAAMVRGLVGRGHAIIVSVRNAEKAAHLAHEVPEVHVADNADVVAGTDVVFLCLMADVAQSVLSDLPFRADQSVISVMADVALADLRSYCAPATDIAVTIPLSAIATGGSMLPVFPASAALEQLFGDSDTILPVASEKALNAYFGGSALSAPLIAMMQTGSKWLAEQTGDPKGAETYVAGVFAAFLREMIETGADFDTLLKGLATEGGLNASLKSHMAHAGAHEALTEGLDALKPRLGL